jgi:ABC-type bacteriocin/lantibiotic exporter with double-glycine peptidase domain
LIGIAITGLLQVLQLRIVENIQQDLFTRSAFEFAFRLPKITYLQLDKIHAPELVNRFFDTITIQKGLPKILIDFSLAAFQIIFGLILLTIYSFNFIILGIALILIIWLIFQITGPQGLSTSLRESKYKYQLAHWLEEIARVNRSFKLHASSKFHLQKTDNAVIKYLSARESHFKVLLKQFKLFVGFKVFVAAGLLVLGGILVFREQMNIGQFVAAEIIIILIINSVEKVLRVIETIYDVLTALEKIGYVTDLQLDENDGMAVIDNEEAISVRAVDIQFGFSDNANKLFDNLSFYIPPKSRVLINGPSGSGKTTLLQIISGVYTLDDGTIYLNDVPQQNYERESLFTELGVNFPTNQLFEASFKENICMGRTISDQKLAGIIQVLGLQNYFAHQPKGINSQVDSGGRRLPRSIIQKLLIARIIISAPKLLLLEDPLQFVEESEKKRIIDYIMDPDQPWTVILVADSPYWKTKCSQIIELN